MMNLYSPYLLHAFALCALLGATNGASALPMLGMPQSGRSMGALPVLQPTVQSGVGSVINLQRDSVLDVTSSLNAAAALNISAPKVALELKTSLHDGLDAQALLRKYPALIEADPRGAPIVRHEILAYSPSAAGLSAASAAGLRIVRQEAFDDLGLSLIVLQAADDSNTALTLTQLRNVDPAGIYDFNHLYSSAAGTSKPGNAAASGALIPARQVRAVGLIDSGVERTHIAFRDANITLWGCNNTPHPAAHGTAVAALMVGKSDHFQGVAPGATLYAADIYCDSPTGGSASQIVQALAWFAKQKVAVINISLVGPANQTLQQAVAAMVERGYLLVAAVGNDGPAAAPLFPASYPGVVGVSAVDARRQPLPEAGRGPQVMFAAPGNEMLSAAIGTPAYRAVRGTSFAAPIVAALLAGALDKPDPAGAQRAIAQLAQQTGSSAAPNPATGFGIVGEAFRRDSAR